MTSEIFRVNVLIQRFHIGKMNEILSDNFGAKYSRNSRTCRIKYDCAFIIIFYVRKMNNSFSRIQIELFETVAIKICF